MKHRETRCAIFVNGWRIPQRISWKKKFHHPWSAPASSSRGSETAVPRSAERSEDLVKHSVYTHFPKDRNCEICQSTKITTAPGRRRIGGAVLRAENLCDLITADHKVLSEGCESRHNHRYGISVDLGKPTSFLDHVHLVCTQRECKTSEDINENYRHLFEPPISAGATENSQKQDHT